MLLLKEVFVSSDLGVSRTALGPVEAAAAAMEHELLGRKCGHTPVGRGDDHLPDLSAGDVPRSKDTWNGSLHHAVRDDAFLFRHIHHSRQKIHDRLVDNLFC